MSCFAMMFHRPASRLVWLGVLGILGTPGCASDEGGGGGGPEEIGLTLSNVNSIPGLEIDLKDGTGSDKSWRVSGGSPTTGPIALGLTPNTVTVLVEMADDEELRITARHGLDAGSPKSCRRASAAGAAGSDVKISDLDDVRCTGDKWQTPDPQPVSDCLSPIVLSDDFTSGTQWSAATTGGTGTTSHAEINNASGGNPGGYRHMSENLPGPSSINVNHLYSGGSYTPATAGAIRYLHYSEDRIQFSPPFVGAQIGTLFYLKQAGFDYYAEIAGSPQFATTNWQRGGIRRLIPAGFLASARNSWSSATCDQETARCRR